jgi:hypothetical protein
MDKRQEENLFGEQCGQDALKSIRQTSGGIEAMDEPCQNHCDRRDGLLRTPLKFSIKMD